MKDLNRRGFLRTGIAGTAGIIALSPILKTANYSQQKDNLIYRNLGKTGLKVPVISFGVERADPNLCKASYEQGIKYFDTAYMYGNGKNEAMIGDLVKDYPRNSFILSTKVYAPGVDRSGKPSDQTTSEAFLKKFYTSLERLKMDYVDILFVHDVRNPEIIEHKAILDALKKLKKDGKVRFAGISAHANEAAIINAACETTYWDVVMTGYNFTKTNLGDLNSAINRAVKSGIGIVAIKTMAGGFLDKEKTKPVNSAAALKWVLANPDISTIVSGMTNYDQLDLNIKILSDISISDAEKKDLLLASSEKGLYCTGCSNCLKTCSLNLPVPDLMRAYMYAYGYSNPGKAGKLLKELGTNDDPCRECNSCKVICTKSFNIKKKIADISRLVNVPSDFFV